MCRHDRVGITEFGCEASAFEKEHNEILSLAI
jgi:hypothetical protein